MKESLDEYAALQNELSAALADIRDLKHTVIALRGELETADADKQAISRRIAQTHTSEIAQLKTTVGVLRDELGDAPHIPTPWLFCESGAKMR